MKKNFNLEEEIICGYKVTSEVKKAWKVELDLLLEFKRVCEKYNLKYFLISGSLIGVVRHKGFIPWDDDIDIGMLREDYNKLLKVADKEFKEPLFFQTPYNDRIFRAHAQLRNSNTSAILPSEIEFNHNQGIFIDIFPFDEYPKSRIKYFIHKQKINFMQRMFFSYLYSKKISVKSKILNIFSKIVIDFIGFKKFYSHYEKVCAKYNGKGNGMISNLAFKYGRDKYMHDKKYFDELIVKKFEDIDILVPKEYDKILSRQYGNYMEYKIGTSMHGELYINADIPYKKYLKKLRNKSEKI